MCYRFLGIPGIVSSAYFLILFPFLVLGTWSFTTVLVVSVFRSFAQFFRNGFFIDIFLQETFYLLEIWLVLFVDQCDGSSVSSSTCSSSYAMYIVFLVVWNIIVDYQLDVIYVNSSCHDVCGYEDIYFFAAEEIHNLISLVLRKVAVHGPCIIACTYQGYCQFLSLYLRASEDNHFLWFFLAEQMLDNAEFLYLITDKCTLFDVLCRFANSQFYFHGIVHDSLGQLLYLVGHGGTEQNCLSVLRQEIGYLHDILAESHVQHAVSLIEDKE